MKKLFTVFLAALTAFAVMGCGDTDDTPPTPGSDEDVTVDQVVDINPNLIVGGWEFYPDTLDVTARYWEDGSTDENGNWYFDMPFFLQFRSDGTLTYKEGFRIFGGIGGPDWFWLTEGYDGTYVIEGNLVSIEFTHTTSITDSFYSPGQPLDHPVKTKIEVFAVVNQYLLLKWSAEAPPYFIYDSFSDGVDFSQEEYAADSFNDLMKWRSASGSTELPARFSAGDAGYASVVTRPDELSESDEYFTTTAELVMYNDHMQTAASTVQIPANTTVKKIGQMADNDDWYFVEFKLTFTYRFVDEEPFDYVFYGWVNSEYLEQYEGLSN